MFISKEEKSGNARLQRFAPWVLNPAGIFRGPRLIWLGLFFHWRPGRPEDGLSGRNNNVCLL